MKYFKRLELQVFYRVVIISTSQAFQAQHVPSRPSDFHSTLLALQKHTDRSSTLHSFSWNHLVRKHLILMVKFPWDKRFRPVIRGGYFYYVIDVTIVFRSLHWNFRKTYKRGGISSVEATQLARTETRHGFLAHGDLLRVSLYGRQGRDSVLGPQ